MNILNNKVTAHRVLGIIPGDGFGKKVVPMVAALMQLIIDAKQTPLTLDPLHDLCGSELGGAYYQQTGRPVPENFFERLKASCQGILMGPLGHTFGSATERAITLPEFMAYASTLLLEMRFNLDQYNNFRPVKPLIPSIVPDLATPELAAKLEILTTENNLGHSGQQAIYYYDACDNQIAETTGLLTKGSDVELPEDTESVVEYIVATEADYTELISRGIAKAQAEGKPLTLVLKANAMPEIGGLGREVQKELLTGTNLKNNYQHVDIAAAQVMEHPENFGVIVTEPLFADVLSSIQKALKTNRPPIDKNNIHIRVYRENIQGAYLTDKQYSGRTGEKGSRTAWRKILNTKTETERIIRATFDDAKKAGRKVAVVTQSSRLPATHALYRDAVAKLRQEEQYNGLEYELISLSEFSERLVADPTQFQDVVSDNLIGDIISDMCNVYAGGVGFGCSANKTTKDGVPMFQAVGGTAPSINPDDINPCGIILSAVLAFEFFDFMDEAKILYQALVNAIAKGAMPKEAHGEYNNQMMIDAVKIEIELLVA